MIRLAGALLSEQNDEWLVQRRYLSIESMSLAITPIEDAPAGMPLRPALRADLHDNPAEEVTALTQA